MTPARRIAVAAGIGLALSAAFALYEFWWSPATTARLTLGGETIEVRYAAPSVRGRQIFGAGGLLSHDPTYPVWRAGANFATTLSTTAVLDVGGLAVPAGTYTVYIQVEDPDAWELIVNGQNGQWGRSYDPRRDLGRVRMGMSTPAALVETLTYTLRGTSDGTGELGVAWEHHLATVPFAIAKSPAQGDTTRRQETMPDLLSSWVSSTSPAATTLAWSLVLAAAAAAGYLVQRYARLPKVAGYSVVGAIAGFIGFADTAWPLAGDALFLLEMGIAVVLFEAGARISLRWFRHNPMVPVQSLVESVLTFVAVYWLLRQFGVAPGAAEPLAIIAVAASPAVLMRVVMDARAAGPVTERAIVLSTLSTLYALTIGSALAGLIDGGEGVDVTIVPVVVLLGLSAAVAVLLGVAMRVALRVMSPASESTSMLLLALIAASTALATLVGGSAALSALLAGLLLKQVNPRPWVWPRQLGTAAAMLTMLMFVLVSTVAAGTVWTAAAAAMVLGVVAARLIAKIAGTLLASPGSGLSLSQALWTGCAMLPMSSVALLLTSQFALASKAHGDVITGVALPAILMMEVAGGVMATVALQWAGETSRTIDREAVDNGREAGA